MPDEPAAPSAAASAPEPPHPPRIAVKPPRRPRPSRAVEARNYEPGNLAHRALHPIEPKKD